MSLKQLPGHNSATLPPQEIIDLFKVAFGQELYSGNLSQLEAQIQDVKSCLYNREYIEAFKTDERRTAYVCRWTPSRAISYASLFSHFPEILEKLRTSDSNVLCVGGGAGAELVALASIFTPAKFAKDSSTGTLQVNLIDLSDWDHVLQKMITSINDRWLYKQTSADFKVQFTNRDVLTVTETGDLAHLDLITLLFTTNELFKQDRAGSIRFLQSLNKHCKIGSHLLIAESAGSYSHIKVGKRTFPVQFLVDTVLVGPHGKGGPWELVQESDSLWYRCPPELDYCIKLENMRFFYRLYTKTH
ncbi:25S rRNA (uracil2843-N3)-methyltransferase KNAG_0L00280 [Huiozyma naganishii CBS 8797]|uniref:Uncharacterized protein n=1 Tax=Huiozyma naganishii (strain ATCC MYA-139 / BCRC 22969 / CBS 8797 / KCTC 17520 / NBRC 10181 / NCYC 3082 / Yp74L-3) TaxID=1071383 RepID=J7SB15_HUIN7|nr:hypothetical protein KNAG_0L00280 [Kazachstania naganishii CBS 8797]CCK72651.1 hypothetical protein KNAG_0L00280 [Kazachstania naganishii CBS 8797]